MISKINSIFLLIILILLQSCSGGRLGKFLETSFQNIEELKIKEDIKNNSENKIVKKLEKESKKDNNIEELKIKEDIKNNSENKIVKKLEQKPKKDNNIEELRIKEDIKNNSENKIVKKIEKKSKNNKKIIEKNILRPKKKI